MSILNALTGLNVAGQVATERTTKTDTTSTKAATTTTAQQATATSDSVSWSAASTAASALQGTDGEVRMDKVATIQKALADGTYQVPTSDVADALVASMLGRK